MSIDFLKFLKEWNQGKDSFIITTSGSTGNPKRIELKRELLIYSAEQTYKELSLNKLTKILNCIPTDKVGGFMNWVRATHFKLDVQTVEPVKDPMIYLSKEHNFNFVSLVPYQLYSILESEESTSKLNRFRTVLIGGSELNLTSLEKICKMSSSFYQSYGMTETYSHIGLKKIQEKGPIGFKPIGDIKVKISKNGTILEGTITANQPLEINDILEWNGDGTFNFLGRRDNIINTGGIKVSPELIEKKIGLNNEVSNVDFMISSIPDIELGNKIVLLVSEKKDFSFSNLEKFEKPKEIFYPCTFVRMTNGKILRKESLQAFLEEKNGE